MALGLASILRPPSRKRNERQREDCFGVSSRHAPLPKYDSLLDQHLRHMWMTPRTRAHLKATGFVDEQGNTVDVDQYRRKLHVIEQELVHADRYERDRVQDKERRAMERQIRAKRQEADERRRRMVSLLREERRQRPRLFHGVQQERFENFDNNETVATLNNGDILPERSQSAEAQHL
eukprot:gnl/MRDRNA2_/MRDRNA2_91645_c0_seq1.p1 gnl/MRDRNA2_/MRDRNA2_91645_c0~~gnl/MRDRNA2_/MRDRNA2_91645_c0_seq1.p1  ORF type:complete len:178 (-),score=25.84 gnl/MRDRNA2_/MRDRNA2_91645_c0_seq1:144-677(-)